MNPLASVQPDKGTHPLSLCPISLSLPPSLPPSLTQTQLIRMEGAERQSRVAGGRVVMYSSGQTRDLERYILQRRD